MLLNRSAHVRQRNRIIFSLARVAFPPHRSNAHVRPVFHCLTIGHTSSVKHRLSNISLIFGANSCENEYTCAPGKSWPLVIVEEYLLRTGLSSLEASSGRWGKSKNLGCSGSFCFSIFEGSISKDCGRVAFYSRRGERNRDS